MTTRIAELAAIAAPPIRSSPPAREGMVHQFGDADGETLLSLLQLKNGFYAFEAALHVLSDKGASGDFGLFSWNSYDLWRREYQGMADPGLFFAEDVFGSQFCLREGRVFSFDPETGSFERIAESLEDWAGVILKDYELWTGYSLAHSWQTSQGTIPAGRRLVPMVPFVLGGQYEVSNLRATESLKGMRYRASIAVQIRNLPDGASVKLLPID
jgi:hypothetical protein